MLRNIAFSKSNAWDKEDVHFIIRNYHSNAHRLDKLKPGIIDIIFTISKRWRHDGTTE